MPFRVLSVFLLLFCQLGIATIHTANKSASIALVPAEERVKIESKVTSKNQGVYLTLRSNGIPDHKVGEFPSQANPNRIQEQNYFFRIPLKPVENVREVAVRRNYFFGVALNGVPFDSYSEDFYNSKFENEWNYFMQAFAIDTGLDDTFGHPNSRGMYHYHGPPLLLMESLGWGDKSRFPQIGWAADGHPIFAVQGPDGREYRSSYRAKQEARPPKPNGPGGVHEGAFNADYVFDPTIGDLDACNGISIQMSGGRKGYAYIITREYPGVPKCFRGLPHSSFAIK